MTTPLKLLLIDDNPDDRSLVMRELKKEFHSLQVRQIIDESSLLAALDAADFDIVITDYQLRFSDGLTVLKKVKAQCPDIPVIMFTGTGSEEVAVEAMKAGLDEYVLKSPRHFARLPSAVHMVLKLSSQKRELKAAETRFSSLFETVPVGLFRMTPAGQFLDANPALVKMLGATDRSALLKSFFPERCVDPEAHIRWRETLERDGTVAYYETPLISLDGRQIWVEINARALRDPVTMQIVYEGSIEDISERTRAQRERERLIQQLQQTASRVRTLSGLLPICSSCKKIRDDKGYWNQIEIYIQEHSQANFTHSFCPECVRRLYPEIFDPVRTE
ncbi:MAG: response regulator [Verrucomicrobiota bacterium]|nr:response regulator [Verrucomicrobiota bacterium]